MNIRCPKVLIFCIPKLFACVCGILYMLVPTQELRNFVPPFLPSVMQEVFYTLDLAENK
jgi:hypothetical protein